MTNEEYQELLNEEMEAFEEKARREMEESKISWKRSGKDHPTGKEIDEIGKGDLYKEQTIEEISKSKQDKIDVKESLTKYTCYNYED